MTSRCALNDAAAPHDKRSFVIEGAARGHAAQRRHAPPPAHQPAGRFIWQLVGVLETYGSICLIGTKV